MRYYNDFFRKITNDDSYTSEIAIINTNDTIIANTIAYIDYTQDNKWKKGYFKSDDYLKKEYHEHRISQKYTDDRIKNIIIITRYHCYIKIINDYKNPILNGEIMLLNIGSRLSYMIGDYMIDKNTNTPNHLIDNSIIFIVKKKNNMLNYEDSFFSNNKILIEDHSLNINDDVHFNKFNILNMNRKDKLKKLNKL